MELIEELIWSLRALAQDASAQRALYPEFVMVADELVLEFDDALKMCDQGFQERNTDIAALSDLIDSKGGQPEFWSDSALEQPAFWADIRQSAREILLARNLPTAAPNERPNGVTYVPDQPVLWTRLRARFRHEH